MERRLLDVKTPDLDSHKFQHSVSEFKEGLERTESLQVHLKQMGVPTKHPFWGSLCKHFLPADRESLERSAVEAKEAVIALKNSSAQLAEHLKLKPPDTCETVESLIRAAHRALAAPNLAGTSVESTEWRTHSSDLEIGLNAGERLSELHSTHDHILIPEAWKQNVLEIRQILAVYGSKRWRVIFGEISTCSQ